MWECVLLAAGASSRMGEIKALLPWENRTLIEHQIREIAATRISRIVLVLGAYAGRIVETAKLDRLSETLRTRGKSLDVVVNHRWSLGKSGSVCLGVQEISPQAMEIAVVAVDQPLRAEILESLMALHSRGRGDVSIPTYLGVKGHPIVCRASVKPHLMRATEAQQGLKGILRGLAAEGRVDLIELAAPSVLWNINRPQDLAAIRASKLSMT